MVVGGLAIMAKCPMKDTITSSVSVQYGVYWCVPSYNEHIILEINHEKQRTSQKSARLNDNNKNQGEYGVVTKIAGIVVDLNEEWTRKLIKNMCIVSWTNRRFGQTNYRTTQFLSDHGYFQACLHKFKKIDFLNYRYYNNEKDNVEHTMFKSEA